MLITTKNEIIKNLINMFVQVFNKSLYFFFFMKMSNVSIYPLWYSVALSQQTFN